jgi:hypothetical protein
MVNVTAGPVRGWLDMYIVWCGAAYVDNVIRVTCLSMRRGAYLQRLKRWTAPTYAFHTR